MFIKKRLLAITQLNVRIVADAFKTDKFVTELMKYYV